MPSVWATQILPDYCQSEKLCQNKCPAKAQGTASLNPWKACTTLDTWTNWVSHVEFRPTLSPIVLMKLGNALRWCDGESWHELLPEPRTAQSTSNQAAAGKGNLWDKAGSNPNTHLRPEECTSALWVLAPAANPLHLRSTCSCTQADPTPDIQLGRLPKPLEYRSIK